MQTNKIERRDMQLEIRETDIEQEPTETQNAQAWFRVVGYGQRDSYGTAFGPNGAKEYLDAHPNRPTLKFGHGMLGGISDILGHRVDYRDTNDGLDVLFEFDDFDVVPNAKQAWHQLKSGSLDSFSIEFIRNDDAYDKRSDTVMITAYDLPAVGIVTAPSNKGTGILSMSGARSEPADLIGNVIIRFSQGEIDLADTLTEVRELLVNIANSPVEEDEIELATEWCSDEDIEYRATYTDKQRVQFAKQGKALSDGSYPIDNEVDLERAVKAVGRGTNNSRNAIRRHIMKRAKALGATTKIPQTWNADGSLNTGNVSVNARAADTEDASEQGGEDEPCPTCKGEGTIGHATCPDCGGSGKLADVPMEKRDVDTEAQEAMAREAEEALALLSQ